MQGAIEQGLAVARKLGDGIKTQLTTLAPEPVRGLVEATPSLVLLLIAVFVGLVLLQILLSVLTGGKRKRAEDDAPSAPPVHSEGRSGARPNTDPKRPFEPPQPPRHDPRPGYEAAHARAENAFMIGDLKAARASFEEAERIARRWAGEDPNPDSFRAFARTLLRIADVRLKAGELDSAGAAAQEALSAVRALADSRPGDSLIQRELAVALERTGVIAIGLNDKAGARRAWEEELQIASRLASHEGHEPSWQRFLAVVHVLLGNLNEPDALSHYDRALRHFEACAQAGILTPADADTRTQLRMALRRA